MYKYSFIDNTNFIECCAKFFPSDIHSGEGLATWSLVGI